MTQLVQLNPVQHAGLRLRTERSAALGDNVMLAPVFPHEFRLAQANYPVVFSRDKEGGLIRPLALFGLERDSNLFLNASGWDADWIPVAHRMKPFLIGRKGDTLEVHVDIDHPRISQSEGEPLFLPDGQPSARLDEVSQMLADVHEAEQSLAGFSAMLDELELVEPFTLDLTLDSGKQGRLAGYLMIAEERLYGLDGETLGRLQAAGFLQPVFMAVASLSRLAALVRRRNALDTELA